MKEELLCIDDTFEKPKSFWRTLAKAALLLTLGFGVFVTTGWLYEPSSYQVIGTSMFPNLLDGDTCVIMNRNLGSLIDVKDGDIVILTNKGEKFLVKRVVGLPGDNIEIRDGRLFVNGKKENRLNLLLGKTEGRQRLKLRDDQYFVLGDNRMNSHDSRSFGPIRRDQIYGVVFLRWRSLSVR